MIESHEYFVEVTSTGLKTGLLEAAEDRLPPLDVSSPPEFGGPAQTWNPEHLFVASIATCLMTTFRSVADASGLEVLAYRDRCSGHLQRGEDRKYSFTSVTLRPTVTIADATKRDRALRLIEKAEGLCLVSRSVACDIVLEPTVEVSEPAPV